MASATSFSNEHLLALVDDAGISGTSLWDPDSSSDWDKEKPTNQCILRIKRDIMTIYNEPPPGMCIVPDKDDITMIHALITGPFDTPYEGGFFYFLIRCPHDYPIRAPRVKLITTGEGKVRFNPNLYKNGKVCLSIIGRPTPNILQITVVKAVYKLLNVYTPARPLRSSSDPNMLTIGTARTKSYRERAFAYQRPMNWNRVPGNIRTVEGKDTFKRNLKTALFVSTWSGPAWSPAQSLSSILISIQSLLNEKPYHNEPGFQMERNAGDAQRYNDIIRHETLRVAVCDMLERKCACPDALCEVMEKSYLDYYEYYEGICKNNMHLQGQTMQDPFGERRGQFDYVNILKRLEVIKIKLNENQVAISDSTSSSDSEMEASSMET